jgi:hypothetical protein
MFLDFMGVIFLFSSKIAIEKKNSIELRFFDGWFSLVYYYIVVNQTKPIDH